MATAMTAEAKLELSRVVERSTAVRKAEVAAFVRFAGGLRVVGGRVVVSAAADHLSIAQRLQRDLHDLYGCAAQVQQSTHPGPRRRGQTYVHVVRDAEGLARQIGLIDPCGRPIFGLLSDLVQDCSDDAEGLWRGAFLAGGSLNCRGPGAGLDINCPGPEVGSVLIDAAGRLGVSARPRVVRGMDRVRVRDGQEVKALLCRMGAPQAGSAWAERHLRPAPPPMARRNFETANARRCSAAAAVMVSRVHDALVVLGETASGNLAEAGRLRLQYPSASLAELGQMATPPMSKDAVAGRIRRLLALAEGS